MKAKYAGPHRPDTWRSLTLVVCFMGCNGPPPPSPKVTSLPSGVTSNAPEFRQQTEALVSDPTDTTKTHYRWRPCQGPGGGCSVSIKIETLYKQPIDRDSPPSAGMLAGRFTNLSPTHTEKMYLLLPSNQAKYVLWVDREPGTNRTRWTLLKVPTSAAGGREVTIAHQETLEFCHPWEKGELPRADVDFAEYKHPGLADTHPCMVAIATNDRDHTVSHASAFNIQPLVRLIGRFVNRGSPANPAAGPAWFGCTDGCCR